MDSRRERPASPPDAGRLKGVHLHSPRPSVCSHVPGRRSKNIQTDCFQYLLPCPKVEVGIKLAARGS
jgi:hypothetical protein